VADLDWRPTWVVAREVAATIEKWRLSRSAPDVYRIDTERHSVQPAKLEGELPPNLMVVGKPDQDSKVAEALMGPSAAVDRYLAGAIVILGVDYKVLTSEEHDFVVETPPMNGHKAVDVNYDLNLAVLQSGVYPASWATTRPVVAARGERSPASGFSGVW